MLHRASLCVLAPIVISATAHADLGFVSIPSDAALAAQFPDAVRAVTAEGRAGNLSDSGAYELSLGRVETTPVVTDQFIFQNLTSHRFSLVYNVGLNQVAFTMEPGRPAERTILYTPAAPMVGLVLRAAAQPTGSSTLLESLRVDGEQVGTIVAANGPNDVDIVYVQAEHLLADGFTITGNVIMEWDTLNPPSNAQASFQIMLMTIPSPTAGGSAVVLGALGMLRRRRRA